MFCASELDPAASQSRKLMRRSITVSGVSPVIAVVSKTSGLVYEKSLILKYIRCASRPVCLQAYTEHFEHRENEGKDPVTGESLAEDDLLDLKTCKPVLAPV